MSKTTIVICAALLIAAMPAAKGNARPPAEGGTISGTVVDAATHAGLNGASVVVRGTPLRASTDGSGAFTIEEVPAGSAVLQVIRTGYIARELSVSVVPGEPSNWTIALSKKKR